MDEGHHKRDGVFTPEMVSHFQAVAAGRRPASKKVQSPLRAATVASDGELVCERFPVTFEGYTYKYSTIAYVKGRGPAPVVLINPNYCGLKQFDVDVACFLAKCGYVGFAMDLFKESEDYTFEDRDPAFFLPQKLEGMELARDERAPGRVAKIVEEAQKRHGDGSNKAIGNLVRDKQFWRNLMGAQLAAARTHPAVHKTYAATIGYCLGGMCILEQVRAGHEIQAAVSFHGLLQSPGKHKSLEEYSKTYAENKYATNCKVLIENGDYDDLVSPESIAEWKREMDQARIDWRFNNHARTPHGFALKPGSPGAASPKDPVTIMNQSMHYVEAADRRSTLSMLSLFAECWPEYPQYPVETNACGTRLNQRIITPAAKL